MDPLTKLKLDKERAAAKQKIAAEEAERIANLPPEGMSEVQHRGTKALFEIFDDQNEGRIHRNRMGSLLVKVRS
jgi:hypothetical protein